jgi:hypothetical protein
MRLMNNHEYGIVLFVTSQKPRMYLHMNVTLGNTVFKKRQENKGRTFRSSVFYLNNWELPTVILFLNLQEIEFRSSVFYLNNWELPTVILFLNLQEIDIWKSYVTLASSSENQMWKQRQSGWFFLNLNIFQCVSVT